MFKFLKKNSRQQIKKDTVSNDDYAQVKHLIDTVFVPSINKSLAKFNKYLKENHKIHVAIDIEWIIQKID